MSNIIKDIAKRTIDNPLFPTFLIMFEPMIGWRKQWFLFRLRFELWKMKTFRLFRKPLCAMKRSVN